MDNQDQRPTHISGHESHGVYICPKCGWPFPNPHPSARHRRAHKKICGTIEGYKLLDSEGHTHSNASDDEHLSEDDHKVPSLNAIEKGKNEKGNGGIATKVNRSEDEVYSDAVADFSDSGTGSGIEEHLRDSSDSTTSVERVDRKDPKFSEPSEDKAINAAGVSQLIVKSSDDCQMKNPKVLLSDGAEVGKTLELQGQLSGFTVEPLSSSVSDLRIEASTVDSHLSKTEAMSDVIPENKIYAVENVTDCSLTSVPKEANLKEKDEIESDVDMVEIVVSSNDFVGETSEGLSDLEVNNEVNLDGEVSDGAVKLKEKNSVEFPSVASQDDLPLEVDSLVNTNASTNSVQVESEHVLHFASSSDLVETLQEKGEGNVNAYPLSKPDVAHPQGEFEDCKGHEGVVLQNSLSLHSSEELKHGEDDTKETVTEEYHSNFNSSQLSEKKEQAEVSPIELTVDGDQKSIEIGASVDSMNSVMNETSTVNFSEEPESDDVCKSLQHINLLEGSVMVSTDKLEDFKDCEGAELQNPVNLHSSEAFKDKEDDLKDAVTEENHPNFKSSQLSEESEVTPADMQVLDNSIKQEQVNCEVEDILVEERVEVSPVTPAVESNQRSDEVGASLMAMNTKMIESHVVHFSGEQKSDDVRKTSQELSFAEGSVMASSNNNLGVVSSGSSTSQSRVTSMDDIGHREKNRNGIDDVAVDSRCRGDTGIRPEALQPSDLLQSEAKPPRDVFKSDDADESVKIENCDITDTQCREGPIVKDTSLSISGSSHFESPIVSEDLMGGYARKSIGIDCTNIDPLSGTQENIKEDEINNNGKVQEECNSFVVTFSNLHQAQDAQPLLKAVENQAGKPSSHLHAEQSSQCTSAVEDNPAVEPSGEASGTSAVPVQDRSGNNLIKPGSSGIDFSVDSSSRCDSLEGNWGSVSVLSVQSDAPAVIDGEALPLADSLASTEAGKSKLNNSKAASEGQRSEKSEMFEPPSFMTLVEPGHAIGPEAAASETQKGHNPQQPSSTSLQAGWFPTLTQVVNESQGRKKNEEIIAKVTNWSTSKQHTPLKSLLGEAAHSNKPTSPKLDENLGNQKNGKVPKDNGSGLKTVNAILGPQPESPAAQAQAVKGEVGKEWNSPARYPADIQREKRKVKSRPYWIQFVCCSSVDPR